MERPLLSQFPSPRSPQDLASYYSQCRDFAGSDGLLYASLVEAAGPLREWGEWNAVWTLKKSETSRVFDLVTTQALAQPDGDAEEWLLKQSSQEHFLALGRIGTDRAFNAIVAAVERCEKGEVDGYQEPWWALACMALAFPKRRVAIQKILLRSLGAKVGVSVTGAAHAILDLELRDAVPALRKTLSRLRKERDYDLDMAAGRIAVVLSLFDDRDAVGELETSFAEAHAYHEDNTGFPNEFRYALWMLRSDVKGAKSYLEDSGNRVGLAYAACALADLSATQSLPTLIAVRATLTSNVCRMAFDEAITRLQSPTKVSPAERMILLFGRRSQSEMGTGAGSDNQFTLRARADNSVVEVDDSGSFDR
jgi:hypothetical protein